MRRKVSKIKSNKAASNDTSAKAQVEKILREVEKETLARDTGCERYVAVEGPVRRSLAEFRARTQRIAVMARARMRPSMAPWPKRPASAWVTRDVASAKRVESRASISLRSGVP